MAGKFFVYIFSSILVVWSIEAVNINQIFKKNRPLKSTTFYFLLGISLIYLVTNFIMDLYTSLRLF